jgi:hypothetical protein
MPLLLLVLTPCLVNAQPPAGTQAETPRMGRPIRGLFGGIERDPNRYRSLDLSVDLLGGYDDNVASGGGGGISDPRFGENGGLGTASGSLTYRRGRNENFFTASAQAGYRYYQAASDLNAAHYGGNLGLSFRPFSRAQLSARQDLSYEPYFSFMTLPVFPSEPGAGAGRPPLDYSVAARPSVVYSTTFDGGYDLSRRTHLALGYSFRGLDFTERSDDGRLHEHAAHAGINKDVTRHWRVGGRYVFGQGNNRYTGDGVQTTRHGGELTVDYRRALRSGREVTVGFAPGYSRLVTETQVDGRRVDRRGTASVRAGVDVARDWTLTGDYRRGLRQIPGLRRPVFADDVQVGVSGLVARRTDVSATIQYSEGDPSSSRSRYTTLGGTSDVRFALSRNAAVTVQYIYYRYRFGPEAELPEGMGRRFDRHAARVGMQIWVPLHR